MMMDKAKIAVMLKDARAMNKMSVEEVAAVLKSYGYEIAPKSLYNYETGNSMPQVPMFLALCKIYGIDNPLCGEYRKRIEVSEKEEALISRFRAAPPELQDAALRVLSPYKVG